VIRFFGELRRYPSAIAGLVIIAFLVMISIYAVVAIPYGEAIRLWRGGEALWLENPRNVPPAWMRAFQPDLPPTIVVRSQDAPRQEEDLGGGVRRVTIPLSFDYPFGGFPGELSVFFETNVVRSPPHVALFWRPPDGTEIPLHELTVRPGAIYRISGDARLRMQLGGAPEIILLARPEHPDQVFQGRHELTVRALLFEPDSQLEARLVVYGQVHGLAGTDHLRRDLIVPLLWGAPIALAFGLLAALGSTVSTLVIAAIGVWYSRWVDGLIQRITEVNLILPALPILIMIGTLYSRSIWVILGVVILLGIFGAGIKTFRALFLQIKEAPYIEAARAYGARGLRMVFHYMIPRAVPVLLPTFVTLIPGFVFLEASLAVLGLGDPLLPTWGKVIEDAHARGALFTGHYYWVLQPAGLLMLTGLGFAMLGYTLDRIFNPRLRDI
jgi:peptide/nickel transport system permease protein